VAKLHAEVNRVLAQPDVKEKFNRAGGLEPYITTPEEFTARIRADDAKYAKIVKDIGATVD
jgi:tripartite-type tricarboxylate transporter receptor subunit TctC